MPLIKGFRGFRYDKTKVGDLDAAITPPYDVINAEQRAELQARSPHNMMHLLLPSGEGDAKYQNAADCLNAMIAEGVMKQDEEDSFYLLEQTFSGLGGQEHVRRGFFAVGQLPEEGERSYLGHERTFDSKVGDRLKLTEFTEANLGAVFMSYTDPEGALKDFLGIMDQRPADDTAHTMDGVTVRLWRVPQDDRVTEFFKDKTLYIADGHHRFRTACLYRNAKRETENPSALQPYDFALMGFVAFEDPGLLIWPTHRLAPMPEGFDEAAFLNALSQWFEVTSVDGDLQAAVEGAEGCAIGLAVHGGGQHLLTLRDIDRKAFLGDDRSDAWRDLDVAVLHRGILEGILSLPEGTEYGYEPKADAARAVVDSGAKGLGFFLKGTRADQIRACAEAADPMPQKSTYFFPKLPSGGVIHRLK